MNKWYASQESKTSKPLLNNSSENPQPNNSLENRQDNFNFQQSYDYETSQPQTPLAGDRLDTSLLQSQNDLFLNTQQSQNSTTTTTTTSDNYWECFDTTVMNDFIQSPKSNAVLNFNKNDEKVLQQRYDPAEGANTHQDKIYLFQPSKISKTSNNNSS
ncbi:hypothetical protein DICPUDRAFT_155509 [Dictyostelium purpureum]|uniref:Uncharacterized protein n=1 Tax=Dictyostelium purpureum TaxID=5786 RepID=F0ZU72_DICPU|nr:uncharacterized protein DICPUDRAFT_155509 [Dictyostelium purpureum]EGC32507.1 hypothetical protein DICPUDRAFT_155509 [Dictyostelium purpureum]|eukprot:XP_003290957.1 hypothetical protein DICPUDRAFT_155509 [Dictyostelium purpureum]